MLLLRLLVPGEDDTKYLYEVIMKEYFKMTVYAVVPAIVLSMIYFAMGPEFKTEIFGSYKFYFVFLSCTFFLGVIVFLAIYDMLRYLKLNDSIKGE